MWYRLKLWFSDPAKNLWVHPTIGALFAMAFSLMAVIGNRYIPQGVVPAITAETLSSLLDIIASSMLAVTIFRCRLWFRPLLRRPVGPRRGLIS